MQSRAASPAIVDGPFRQRLSIVQDDLDTAGLLHGLWHETLNVAIRCAAASSLLNMRHDAGSCLTARDAKLFLAIAPQEAPIAVAISSGLVDSPVSRRTLSVLQQVQDAIEAGRTAAEALLHGDPGCTARSAQRLARAWRDNCGLVLGLVYDLELAAPLVHAELRLQAGPELLAVLRSARRGGTPCIDDRGEPFIPEWAQKRTDMRRPVGIMATLEAAGQSRPVLVRDVSRGGFGISEAPVLPVGSSLCLIVEGERLAARVAWSSKGEAGLRLERRLPSDHPLLASWRRR